LFDAIVRDVREMRIASEAGADHISHVHLTQPKTDGLRFGKLGYIALNVTDTGRSRRFYETVLGLQVTDVGAKGEVYLRCSGDHHNIVLYPAQSKGLKRICWQMESESDLDKLVAFGNRLNLALVEVPAKECEKLRQGRSYRFVEPRTRACMEFYAHQDGDLSFTPSVAKIQRLGHVVLTTTQYDEAVSFFINELNFRASDTIGTRITFMRCFPNPYHHSLALGKGAICGLHHVNFMVSEIDDIGKALWRFQSNGVPIVYGPGRHPPSNSVFLYANDPDGLTVEYSFGMEEFPEFGARAPRILPLVQESADTWGGPPSRINPIPIESGNEH
jgi:2,3-dihydroxy-p-cumate/2,3-dihydroxybenzoate 3,4-dioxygenase